MTGRGTRFLLLLLLVAAAYGGSVRNEYVFDDRMFVREDPRVRSLSEAPRLFIEPLWGYTDDDGQRRLHQYYRPLQTFPLALSYAVLGESAWGARLLSLALHLLNATLVMAIVSALLGSVSLGTALAMLFAVHPGTSEAVLWVSDLAGLGAAACTLGLFAVHRSGRTQRWYGGAAAALLCLLGLWFKESGVLSPVLVVLYDLVLAPDRGGARARRLLPLYACLTAALLVYLFLRLHALGGLLPGIGSVPLNATELALNAVALLPQYARVFLWPFDLNMYHDFTPVTGANDPRFQLGAALLAAALTTVIATVRSRPIFAFAVLWTLVTAAPHLLVRWPQLNVFAERYLYLPAVGLLLTIGCVWKAGERAFTGSDRGSRRMRAIGGVAIAALLLTSIALDIERAGDWRDERTIYTRTVSQSPRAELIRSNLALLHLEAGRHDEGLRLMREVIAVNPDWHQAWHNLGLLELGKKNYAGALAAFEESRRRDPLNRSTLLNLGYLYDRVGQREQAVESYLRLVRLDPANASAWYNLAVVAHELGQLGNAREALGRVLKIAPGDGDAKTLLRRLSRIERTGATGAVSPSAETARRCDIAKQAADAGRRGDAIIALEVARWLDERSPLPHQYLANIYYLNGRLADAVRHQREALRLAPGNALYQRNLASLRRELAEGGEKAR